MRLSGHGVLVTGGASGIGLSLARQFVQAGSQVVVCGRDRQKLEHAARAVPGLVTRVTDVSCADARAELVRWVIERLPSFDVLVNNAGIQRRLAYSTDAAGWAERAAEIAINFEAPAHFISLVQSHFATRPAAAIINVGSTLAGMPAPFAPLYAATKAAVHSLSQSIRDEYVALGIRVIEIVPPVVNTDLGGAGLHDHGVDVDVFVDAVVGKLCRGESEIHYP